MAFISFEAPWYLIFLFLIPIFLFFHFTSLRSARKTALKFANFEAIARIRGVDFFSRNLTMLVLGILIIFTLTMALSGLTLHMVRNAPENTYILALDNSQSMEATDLSPNRMEAAKRASTLFVDQIPSFSKLGILSFSGNVLIEQDITDSKIALKSAIQQIEVSEISGTDVLEAVITGSNLLKGENGGAILLLSDGQINVGTISEAIAYAHSNNVLINTIGIGTPEGGETRYGISKLDEDSLEGLAYNTGGEYFRALDIAELQEAFKSILTQTRRNVEMPLSLHMLLLSIILFVLYYFLSVSKFKMF